MIEIKNNQSSNILEMEVTGKFTEADFDHYVPVLKKHIAEAEQPRMLIIIQEFQGWDKAKTFWEDVKLDTKYLNKFDRVALVGDQKWEEWSTRFSNLFTSNEIRFYDMQDVLKDCKWLQAD